MSLQPGSSSSSVLMNYYVLIRLMHRKVYPKYIFEKDKSYPRKFESII